MRKRDIVDGLVGPRTREMMDQMLCMNGMTNAEKVDFLMSRNRELRAENAKLRELVSELASFISRADWLQWPELADRMAELGVEVD